MLDHFLTSNRTAILAGARARVALRTSPKPTELEPEHGIPVFLDQLGDALRLAKTSAVVDHGLIAKSAGQHGGDLLREGLTIAQVVHDYGDICQAITTLALEQATAFSGEEFKTLNLCLDDAIAGAVTEYALQREQSIQNEGTERLGMLAHELRNLINTAVLSFDSIQRGRVSPSGSVAQMHSRSLMGLSNLVDRSLAEVRLDAGIGRLEPISVTEFIEEVEIGALIQAQARGLRFAVVVSNRGLIVKGDRQILAAALSNLLQNAFKFTLPQRSVTLTVLATADRVLFEVEDGCGGLPAGKIEDLFRPFEQRSPDRSGIGLGLSICRKAAKANGGEIRVRDIPGKGCIFTLDLPRSAPPPPVRTQ